MYKRQSRATEAYRNVHTDRYQSIPTLCAATSHFQRPSTHFSRLGKSSLPDFFLRHLQASFLPGLESNCTFYLKKARDRNAAAPSQYSWTGLLQESIAREVPLSGDRAQRESVNNVSRIRYRRNNAKKDSYTIPQFVPEYENYNLPILNFVDLDHEIVELVAHKLHICDGPVYSNFGAWNRGIPI